MKITASNQLINELNVYDHYNNDQFNSIENGYINLYKEIYIPDLEITVKYNPEISDQQADISLKSVSVDRLVGNKTAMTTNALHNVINAGSDVVISRDAPYVSPLPILKETQENHKSVAQVNASLADIPESTFFIAEGTWHNSDKVAISSVGNVFGKSGLFSSSQTQFDVPLVTRLSPYFDKVTQAFGVKVFAEGEAIPLKFSGNLNVAEYAFTPEYENYRLDVANGFFIEKHEFPHVFMPKTSADSGVITLGKQIDDNHYALTNIQIPDGCALLVPEDIIHTDSSSRGDIIVTLTDCVKADTVLIHDQSDQPFIMQQDKSERIGLSSWYV